MNYKIVVVDEEMIRSICINTDNIKVPIYGLVLVIGTVLGIILNALLNYKTIKSKDRPSIVICNTILNIICTFGLGSLYTSITTSFKGVGFSSIGGLAGMYLSYYVMSKVVSEKNTKMDLELNFILVIPLIYSLTKIGCLFGSCCYGIEYSGFGSIEYVGEQAIKTGAVGLRLPIQLIETIAFGIIFIIFSLIRYHARLNSKYQVYSLCAVCSIMKFCLEFLRYSNNSNILSVNQLVCIVLLIISVINIIRQYKSINSYKNIN